ncbi:PaaI family thioesterase [Dechloromonas sp. XY25]|uniref:PaaI family thioesterase n=1 Tax=Dechloromonas hankyongensis TaxID=2908002 RepID=A0ABS9K7R1_9RHOO|nr:PaaI family thioesterase [Dechloromonas hankyongensis]MCG2579186.1 PaaI family thioesterase [Dechloromonas hankyongensis]
MSASGEHPERALVRQAIADGLSDLPVTTNPLAIALGTRLLSARDGGVQMAFSVGAGFTQGNGVVQGGIVSALLDFGMTFAAFSRVAADSTVATVSQTTNYFRPALAGELVVDAELEKAGRTLINARATLCDAAGTLLASATAPIAVIKLAA